MLYRVAGVAGSKPFTTRFESDNAVAAVATTRKALNDAGVTDSQITVIRAQGIKGGSPIRFGKEIDPNAPKRTRKAKAATAGAAPKK